MESYYYTMVTPQKKIKTEAIVFDQGNTLLMDPFYDIMEIKRERFVQLCNSCGVTIDGNRLTEEWTRSNGEVNYPYISHFFQEEPIVQHALNRIALPVETVSLLAPELLKEYRLGYKEVIETDKRNEVVKQLFKELRMKGKRMGVFSNDRIEGLDMAVHYLGIRSYLEYIETSESTGLEKPDPGVFYHIAQHFGLPPDLITYVGDDPLRDIEAAKAKNFKVVLLSVNIEKYNENWRDYKFKSNYKPDIIINELSELTNFIE